MGRKMYGEETRKRWQEATHQAIKDGENHARRIWRIVKRLRLRYGSLLGKFLETKEELTRTKRALWLARYERAKERANMLRYMWHVLVSVKKSNDKELVKIVRRDYDVWCEVERKCRKYADKFMEEK